MKSLGWLLLVSLVCIVSIANEEFDELKYSISYESRENSHCQVPYSVVRWKYAYCMTVLESDSIENGQLNSCLSSIEKLRPRSRDVCDATLFYKTKWCETSFERGYVVSVNSCVSDPSLFPSALEQGF